MKVILSVTWWSLFKKRIVRTKFDIYVFIKKTFKYYKLMNYDKF